MVFGDELSGFADGLLRAFVDGCLLAFVVEFDLSFLKFKILYTCDVI